MDRQVLVAFGVRYHHSQCVHYEEKCPGMSKQKCPGMSKQNCPEMSKHNQIWLLPADAACSQHQRQ